MPAKKNDEDVETVETDPVVELAAEANPPARPADAPDLVPFQRLRRRERGRLLAAMHTLESASDELRDTYDVESDSVSLSDAAAVSDVLADAEDVILSAAKDPDKCEAWVAACTDNDLMELLRWYMSVMQVGEAKPSSDS